MAYFGDKYYPPNDYFSAYSPWCMNKFTCEINPGISGFSPCIGPGAWWYIGYDRSGVPYCSTSRNPPTHRNKVYAYKDNVVPYEQPAYKFKDGFECWAHLCGFPEGMRAGKKHLFQQCECYPTFIEEVNHDQEKTKNKERNTLLKKLPKPLCLCKPVYIKPSYYENEYGIHLVD